MMISSVFIKGIIILPTAILFLYGNADMEQELAFIDKEYLSKYDKADLGADVKLNPPFSSCKRG